MITNILYIVKTYFFLLYFILFFRPTVSSFHAHLLALSHKTEVRHGGLHCQDYLLFMILQGFILMSYIDGNYVPNTVRIICYS